MDTPSKLRMPKKTAPKVDLDILTRSQEDVGNLAALSIAETQNQPAPNNDPSSLLMRKRKMSNPEQPPSSIGSRIGVANKIASVGLTKTVVPGRNSMMPSRQSSLQQKPAVRPNPNATAAIPRKQVTSSINLNGTLKSRSISNEVADPETKARLQEMEELTKQLKLQISEYTSNQSSLQVQLGESEQRVRDLENFRSSLEHRVQHKESQNTEIEEELRRMKRQLENERDEATAYTNRIKNELNERIEKLKDEKDSVERELERTKKSLAGSEDENGSLKQTLSRQSATILDLESQIAALKAKLQTAQSEIITRNLTCDELMNKLNAANETIAAMDKKLHEGETLRRKLHNQVQELKGNIRVFCRIRPLMPSELGNGKSADEELKHLAITKKPEEQEELCMIQPVESVSGTTSTKTFPFTFDRVFGPQTEQVEVFEEISQLVQSALDGYRVCIFAYGQTGSGKTFTMEGASNDPEKSGMIPRAVAQIFSTAEALNREKGWNFGFEASYLEIYNETIRDLLGSGAEDCKHEIKHLPNTTKTMVTDLTVVPVEDPKSVLSLLKKAGHNRAVAETLCNDRSSRSHSVFTLKITGSNSITGENIEGLLNLIDLAGSERLSQSGSTGNRLKETQAINKSLSSLGDVIYALSNKDSHVPFRNSKLTYLLQHSLGGNCKTLMFVNVSPAVSNFHETLCSLRFATKVNSCQIGTARRNNVQK